MTERVFFNLRNTAPGFTFILLLLAVNIKFLLKFFMNLNLPESLVTILGILLGFITLASGGAIGYLISQVWYFLSQKIWFDKLYVDSQISELLKKQKVKPDKEILLLFSDYLHHTWPKKEIRTYIERRWDLLNILGSTMVTIPLGLFYGYVIRFIFCGFKFDSYYEALIIISSSILIVIMYIGLRYVIGEHIQMRNFVVKSRIEQLTKNDKALSNHFPKEYFQNKKCTDKDEFQS